MQAMPLPGAGPPNHGERAAAISSGLMSRLPYLRRDEIGPDGQHVWDKIVGTRTGELVNSHGGLTGPFNAFVHAPGVGRSLTPLGAELRFATTIERRLTEVAILTVGARWQAEFEWWAHARMARRHGVPGAVIDAIGRGEDPPFTAGDERAVYAAARQLAATGRLDEDAHEAVRRLLGDSGAVELVTLCGYYTLISFLLNAFDVPLPVGATPQWNKDVQPSDATPPGEGTPPGDDAAGGEDAPPG